mmetsp:Transcript_31160/g.85115  ORF Transcript_31160/g.85115 Transcript_31160/m.85115 type:complete len:161 (+) Transcript_31160:1133-1615(+)|eukprot:scaffold17420_cov29-Tisochrysis_lutea.AAC.2
MDVLGEMRKGRERWLPHHAALVIEMCMRFIRCLFVICHSLRLASSPSLAVSVIVFGTPRPQPPWQLPVKTLSVSLVLSPRLFSLASPALPLNSSPRRPCSPSLASPSPSPPIVPPTRRMTFPFLHLNMARKRPLSEESCKKTTFRMGPWIHVIASAFEAT